MTKLFIHIPKNGGMTIRRNADLRTKLIWATPDILCNRPYVEGLEKTMRKHGEDMGYAHARWRDIKNEVRNAHQCFAIVRNPWSRVVSRYEFAKKVIHDEVGSDHYGELDYATTSSFEDFLEDRHKWGGKEYFWHRAIRGWYPALGHVTDKTGKVRCDILRFEHFNDDVKQYFGMLTNPPPRNVTGYDQSTYKDYYNDRTIQIVADWYKEDIDYWGFDFDTSAQRNYWK